MIDEPTWKKRDCGTSVLAVLVVLAAVLLMTLPDLINLL